MKKKNVNTKLQLRKMAVADLKIKNISGGRAQATLENGCVSYPYRCSIQECVHTDITCIKTDTCQRPSN